MTSQVSMMNFNWSDTSCWLAGFNKKSPAPVGGFHVLNYKYHNTHNISELRYNIERKIMKKISAWRAMRKTIWNRWVDNYNWTQKKKVDLSNFDCRAFQPRMLSILQNIEQMATFGATSSYEELKYNNIMAAEFPNFKVWSHFVQTLHGKYHQMKRIIFFLFFSCLVLRSIFPITIWIKFPNALRLLACIWIRIKMLNSVWPPTYIRIRIIFCLCGYF